VDPKKVRVGMRVHAVWKPASQRTGSITDIAYWEPVPEAKARRKPAKRKKSRP